MVVSCTGRQDAEESCLLGIDCHTRATVGLVLRVLADTAITLDGDGYVAIFISFSLSLPPPSTRLSPSYIFLSLSYFRFRELRKRYMRTIAIKRAVPFLHKLPR